MAKYVLHLNSEYFESHDGKILLYDLTAANNKVKKIEDEISELENKIEALEKSKYNATWKDIISFGLGFTFPILFLFSLCMVAYYDFLILLISSVLSTMSFSPISVIVSYFLLKNHDVSINHEIGDIRKEISYKTRDLAYSRNESKYIFSNIIDDIDSHKYNHDYIYEVEPYTIEEDEKVKIKNK